MEWMYRYMVGIQSIGAAFEKVMFTPEPDMRADEEIPAGQERITFAKGSYMSAHGLIVSEWKRESNGFVYNCETPVKAIFKLPLVSDKKSFKLNGERMNVDDFKIVDGCAVIRLDIGNHIIEY